MDVKSAFLNGPLNELVYNNLWDLTTPSSLTMSTYFIRHYMVLSKLHGLGMTILRSS
jgi:hypothetical protein